MTGPSVTLTLTRGAFLAPLEEASVAPEAAEENSIRSGLPGDAAAINQDTCPNYGRYKSAERDL